MLFDNIQKEALTEFIQGAFSGETISLISQLIGYPATLEISNISLQPLSRLASEDISCLHNEVSIVHQMFKGSMSGDALLLLKANDILTLNQLMNQDRLLLIPCLEVSASEAITEVGNIILNAYLSRFSHLLQLQVSFSVPYFQQKPLSSILQSLLTSRNEVRYSLVVDSCFRVPTHFIDFQVIFVVGVLPLSCFLKAIETWSKLTHLNLDNKQFICK